MAIYYEQKVYWCTIREQGFGQTEGGTPFFFVKMLPEVDGRERTIYWYLTDKTKSYVARDMKRVGLKGGKLSELHPESQNFQDLTGVEIECFCKHETYQGQEREKWSLAKGATAITPLDARAMRQLDAEFGNALKGQPDAEPARREKPAEDLNIPDEKIPEDDIPF